MAETKTTSPPLINALITTFPGLPNYALAVPSSTTLGELFQTLLLSRLPASIHASPLRLSPTSGLSHSPSTPLSRLSSSSSPFLTLRLWTPLCGGKGGFGSQLRAAGGRMSSRKKRGQQENNDSCRNLDGRRMRTVKEAKALAAYLEIKPEMDRKERESRKERWRKVVEAAENREAGQGAASKVRFDDVQWLEATEEERVRTRAAVEKVMAAVLAEGNGEGSSGSGSDVGEEEEEEEQEEEQGEKGEKPLGSKVKEMKFAGWDEDDEFMSSDDGGMSDIDEGEEEEEGKGKGKQTS